MLLQDRSDKSSFGEAHVPSVDYKRAQVIQLLGFGQTTPRCLELRHPFYLHDSLRCAAHI